MKEADLDFTYWKQRMKDMWFCCVDTSARICYAKVRIRKSQNHNHSLHDNEGNWIANNQDMLALLVNFLQKCYIEDVIRVESNDIMNLLHELELPSLCDQQKPPPFHSLCV